MIGRLRWWLADRLRPNVWPSTAAQHGVLLEEIRALTAVVNDYAQHDSWRCEHPPHYYLANDGAKQLGGDCACGLLSALERAGIDPEPWRPKVAG